MSPIRNTDDTTPAELAACRLWEARLERELADGRPVDVHAMQRAVDLRREERL